MEEKESTAVVRENSSSPLGLLPSTWLSVCFSFLDLHALLYVGSVSRHWRSVQQLRSSWVTPAEDWSTSRCWKPSTRTEMKEMPIQFRQMLTNVHLDTEELFGEEEEAKDDDEEEKAVQAPFFPTLFTSLSNLSSLSVLDVDSHLTLSDLSDLISYSLLHLFALSIDRTLPSSVLRALFDFRAASASATATATSATTNEKDKSTKLKRLQLLNGVVPRSAFQPLFVEDASGRIEYRSSLLSSWPLSHSLTALTVTVPHPHVLLPLSHLQLLTELDLVMEYDMRKWTGMDVWRCMYQKGTAQTMEIQEGGQGWKEEQIEPSLWCESLHTLHLTVTGLTDSVLYSLSHLVGLTDLAILHDADPDASCVLPPIHRSDWRETMIGLTQTRHEDILHITPQALYQLRHLTKLEKLELNLAAGWCLALVPFLQPQEAETKHNISSFTSSDSLSSADHTCTPLAFWSSFPSLFQFKYHSPFRADFACLPSLSSLSPAHMRLALSELLPHAEMDVLLEQDLLLYGLAACRSLRSLHLNAAACTEHGIRALAKASILRRIGSERADRTVAPISQAGTDTNQATAASSASSSAHLLLTSSSPSLIPLFDLCLFNLPQLPADPVAASVSLFGSSLRYLHFINCLSLHDEGLIHLLSSCSQLHTLDIRGCVELTTSSLSLIGHHIPGLHSLNVSHMERIDDEIVSEIIRRTPALHSLHLHHTATTSAVLLPIIMQHLHLLCLNVRMNGDRWSREELEEYRLSRPWPMQLISDWHELGEK